MRLDQYITIVKMIKKNKKGIYGSASLKEVKELQEEGIKTETIPWVKEEEN